MVRSDVRADARAYLYETTADLFSDSDLDIFVNMELRSLPRKGVYLEQLWEEDTVVDQQDYSLPSGTYKVEKLEMNYGTSSNTDWQEILGYNQFAAALWLPFKPDSVKTMRIWIRKTFTVPTDDVTAMDYPDEKREVLALGVALRGYRQLIGYMVDQKNYDSIIKPDGITLNAVRGWVRELTVDYNSALNSFRTIPQPKFMDLVN